MSKRVVFLSGVALVLVVYGVAIAVLVTAPGNNLIPTPGRALVAGMIAMFSTLGVFILGFIRTAMIQD